MSPTRYNRVTFLEVQVDTLKALRDLIRDSQRSPKLPPPDERRRLRREARVTQQVLAEWVGVSRAAIGLYEAGARQPRGEHLRRYADALSVLREEAL